MKLDVHPRRIELVARSLLRRQAVGWILWGLPTLFVCGAVGLSGITGWFGIPFLPWLTLPALLVLSSRITSRDHQGLEPILRRLPVSATDVLLARIFVRLGLGLFSVLFCWLAVAIGVLGFGGGSPESEHGPAWQLLYTSLVFYWIVLLAISAGPSRRGAYDVTIIGPGLLGLQMSLFAWLLINPAGQESSPGALELNVVAWGSAFVLLAFGCWWVRRQHHSTYFGVEPEPLVPKRFVDVSWIYLILVAGGLLWPSSKVWLVAFAWSIGVVLQDLWGTALRWRDPRSQSPPTLVDWLSPRVVPPVVAAVILSLVGPFPRKAILLGQELLGNEALVPFLLGGGFVVLVGVAAVTWIEEFSSRWTRRDPLLRRLPIERGTIWKGRAREVAGFLLVLASVLALVGAQLVISTYLAPHMAEAFTSPGVQLLGLILGLGLWFAWTAGVRRLVPGRALWWLVPAGLLPASAVLSSLPWLPGGVYFTVGLLVVMGLAIGCVALDTFARLSPPPPRT